MKLELFSGIQPKNSSEGCDLLRIFFDDFGVFQTGLTPVLCILVAHDLSQLTFLPWDGLSSL